MQPTNDESCDAEMFCEASNNCHVHPLYDDEYDTDSVDTPMQGSHS